MTVHPQTRKEEVVVAQTTMSAGPSALGAQALEDDFDGVRGPLLCPGDPGGLVVELSLMKGAHVDPRVRAVRAEGGATWGVMDCETQVLGLATTGGNVSATGVDGLTLDGGVGNPRRTHGLGIGRAACIRMNQNIQSAPDARWRSG